MTNLTFSQLSLSPALLDAVTEMGFTQPTDIQAQAIPVIQTGADVVARSHTGTGKTVAFGIPAVECIDPDCPHVQVLILCPTRELAQQCGEEMRKLSKYSPHIKAANIYGGADYERQFVQLRRANLVIGTPGRIMDHMERGTLKLDHLTMIVLDEADEMLNMGFKEDIETILKDVSDQRQVVLFSATMPPAIMEITKQFQKDPVLVDVKQSEVALENIEQKYVDVPMGSKPEALNLLLRYYQPHRTIIFANTKTMVDELVEFLSTGGFSAEGLHGDMKQLQRTNVMNGFKRGKVSILVATDVAARGIDVSHVDYVINFDIPKVSEYYVHRIGRTGRAGSSGVAITLCCGKRQVMQLQQLSRKPRSKLTALDIPTVEQIAVRARARDKKKVQEAMALQPKDYHVQMVTELVEQGYEPEMIAAVLLGMHFPDHTKGLTDLKVQKKPERTPAPQEGKGRERIRYADLLIDMGAANRVAPNHIVGAIAERAGLSAREIGKISIFSDHTVVGVPADQVEQVAEAMQGCKICGRPVHTTPLTEPRRKKAGGSCGYGAFRPKKPGKGFTGRKKGRG